MSRLRLRWSPTTDGEAAFAGITGEAPTLVACAIKSHPSVPDVAWSVGVEGVVELPASLPIVGSLRVNCIAHGTCHGAEAGEGAASLARILCEQTVEALAFAMDASVMVYGVGRPPGKTVRDLLEEHPDRQPDEDLVAFAKRMGMGMPDDDDRKVH